jgi:anti-sigma28 factor (negative regulator of flagellin synthesis)
MKISGIGSLFASTIAPVAPSRPSEPGAPVRSTPSVSAEQDAAVVSSQLQQQSRQTAVANSDRQDKLAKIAEQVKNKSYSVDSKKVAESIIRDLL